MNTGDDDRMIWILLGILFAIVLFIARQEDLPYDEEDELLEEFPDETNKTIIKIRDKT